MTTLSPTKCTNILDRHSFVGRSWKRWMWESCNGIPCVHSGSRQGGENPQECGFYSQLLHIPGRWISYCSQTAQQKWNPLPWNPQEERLACPGFSAEQVKGNKDWEGCMEVMVAAYRKWAGFWKSAEVSVFSGTQPHPESVEWMWEISSISSQTCQVAFGKQ